MSEKFANQRAATTLDGSILAADSTLVVASAAGMPDEGVFRIILGQGAQAEIVQVGDISGTTLTGLVRGSEGTTARDWPNNTAVAHILTAASLEAGITDGVTAGVDAHVAQADPHGVYETSAEVQAKVDTHAAAADPHAGYQKESEKAQASGYASLDSSGKVPTSQIPAVAVSNTFVVASEAAMLALAAQVGDIAVRTDLNQSYILTADPATVLGNWQELLAPADAVQSVNGHVGTVILDASDVGAETPTGAQAKVDTHVNDATAAHAASAVAFTPTGSVAASDVQAAIAEVATESAHPNLAAHDSLGLATDSELITHGTTTTSVHGIADTAALETMTGSTAKVTAHTVAADPHGDRAYADSIQQGLDVKEAVVAATTVNITLSGPATLDGYGVIAGDRVLVKNQTTASQNGIYVVSNSAWSRATDADADVEVNPGMFCFVTQGITQSATGWVLTTQEPITVGTTTLAFSQFSGSGQVTAGGGLTKTGNTLDIVGDSSVTVSADQISVATVHGGSSHAATEAAAEATAAADATSKVNTHAAAADPHTGYQKESEKGNASGYASLDGSGTVPDAQIPSSIARDSEVPTSTAGPDADITVDGTGAAGTSGTAARAAHGHKVTTYTSAAAAIGTAGAGTSGTPPARGNHVHPTGAGTPTTQAFGDSPVVGSGPAAAMTDHKHGMPATPSAGSILSYTKAGLPAVNPTTPGTIARVTDDLRGLWQDTGTEWKSITGGMDPRDFGADDTGTTNSDTAFADMLAVFSTSTGVSGLTIYGNAGAYKLSKPWYVFRRGLKFKGLGVGNPANYSAAGAKGHGTTLIWTGPTWTNITTATHSGSTVTITATAHGFTTGDRVTISEVTEASGVTLSTKYNGAFVVTVTGANTFTYTANSAPSVDADAGTGICGFSMVIVEDSQGDVFEDVFFQGNKTTPPVDLLYFNNAGGSTGSNAYQGARQCRFGGLPWTTPSTTGTTGTPAVNARNGIRYGGINTNNDQFHYEYCNIREVTNGFVIDNTQSVWGILHSPELMWCDKGIKTASSLEVHNPQFNRMTTAEIELRSTAQVDVFGWQSERLLGKFAIMPTSGSSLNVYGGKMLLPAGYAQTDMFDLSQAGGQGGLRLDGLRIDATAIGGGVVPNIKVRGNSSTVAFYVTIIDCPGISLADLDIVSDNSAPTPGLGIYVTVLSKEIFIHRYLTAGAALSSTVTNWQFPTGNVVVGKAALDPSTATDGFIYLPSGAGAPSGTPTAFTGTVAHYYDTTNNRAYFYNGGWKYVEASS